MNSCEDSAFEHGEAEGRPETAATPLRHEPAAYPLPASRNQTRDVFEMGFWGTMQAYAQAAWPLALERIAEATGASVEAVRLFLDSALGRRFGKAVCRLRLSACAPGQALSLADALDQVIDEWMAWAISPDVERQCGIPAELPYLKGWVWHYEIELEQEAS